VRNKDTISGLASQHEIQRRMTDLKRKADIKGMVDGIKKNEQKNFSHLFKSPGIRSRMKVRML
jgi:hypothetical protein